VPAEKFRPNDYATYKEFTDALVKIVKYEGVNRNQQFSKAIIDSFGVGGDTSPNAKITKEQAIFLVHKTYNWMVEANGFNETKYRIEHGSIDRIGVDGVEIGVYTLELAKDKGSYVAINPEGKAELSSAKAERFKFTYKGSRTNQFDECMMLYTIQTMDGKYLALSGNVPTSGKRLITQDTEYLWAIRGPHAGGGSFKIYPPDFLNLYVNAEGEKSKDGTPIIVWFETQASLPEH